MGFSLRHIAKQIGVHHHTVKMWLAPEIQSLKEQVAQLTLEGQSLKDIFHLLNKYPYRNSHALWYWLRIADPQYVKEYIQHLHAEGMKLSKICYDLGMSKMHIVRQYLKNEED